MALSKIEIFLVAWRKATVDDADKLMSLQEIKEWWIDNIGEIPSDFTQLLSKNGLDPLNVHGELVWPLSIN